MSPPSRPALRWAVPAGVTALVLGGAVLGPALSASAEVELPDRSPAQLLTDLQSADVDAFAGTVTYRAELGLPTLPDGMGGEHSTGLASLLSGSHDLRVWASGDKARVALHGELGEADVVTDGTGVWTWSSDERTATHLVLPEHDAADLEAHVGPLPGGPTGGLPPMTPEQVSDLVLTALEPTTTLSAGAHGTVAGRPAYELVLTPADAGSLVGSVRISVDAAERVPTRVEVYAAGATDPALAVGFTDLTFAAPDDSVFTFTPPPGATLEEHTLDGSAGGLPAPDDLRALVPDGTDGPAQDAPANGTVVGDGWTAVAVGRVPAVTGRADGDLGAFVSALPRVRGEWGSGRLLESALFSALLTDDGRLLVGAVDGDRLEAVAGDPAAALG